MKTIWKMDVLQDLISFYGKGIVPQYVDQKNCDSIWVLNQKCNTNHKISYDKARYTDIKHKPVSQERYLRIGDIIINATGYGTAGRVAQVDNLIGDTTVDSHMIIIRANYNKVHPKYLAYYMKHNQATIESYAEGSTGQTEISKNRLCYEFKVRYPDLETQKRIAKVLSALDDKIELNNQINKNLEEQAQALYKSWFVDFEPFGRRRPTSWYMGILSDLANISTGKRPTIKSDIKTSEFCIPIVGASSVMGYTSKSNYNDKILITGRVGTHGVIQRFSTACWASDNTLVITSNYYEYVNQILGKIDYSSLNRGSTQPLITQGDMNKKPVLIPDTETLNRFETIVGALMTSYDYNNNENMRLEEVRDSLLPKLMSGEIDVDNVEI